MVARMPGRRAAGYAAHDVESAPAGGPSSHPTPGGGEGVPCTPQANARTCCDGLDHVWYTQPAGRKFTPRSAPGTPAGAGRQGARRRALGCWGVHGTHEHSPGRGAWSGALPGGLRAISRTRGEGHPAGPGAGPGPRTPRGRRPRARGSRDRDRDRAAKRAGPRAGPAGGVRKQRPSQNKAGGPHESRGVQQDATGRHLELARREAPAGPLAAIPSGRRRTPR